MSKYELMFFCLSIYDKENAGLQLNFTESVMKRCVKDASIQLRFEVMKKLIEGTMHKEAFLDWSEKFLGVKLERQVSFKL